VNKEPRASGVGALWLQRALLSQGLTEADITAACDIDFERLKNAYPYYRFPMSNLGRLFAFAAAQLDDPAIAIKLAKLRLNEAHNLRTAAASTAATNAEAMMTWARYSPMDLSDHIIQINYEPENSLLTLHAKQSSAVPDVWLSEIYIGTAASLMEWFTQGKFQMVEASFEHAPPHYVEAYRKQFCSRLYFGREHTTVVFKSPALEEKPPNASRYMHQVFCKEADKVMLDLVDGPTSIVEVKQLIFFGLQTGEASAQQVAQQLGMDRSTLARQLSTRGTSFSKLLEEVRRESALRLLKQGESIKRIAVELAYSEPSAFQHAFRRWFGMSPRRYREQMMGQVGAMNE
jgi:AraC-like DNA-binding protein